MDLTTTLYYVTGWALVLIGPLTWWIRAIVLFAQEMDYDARRARQDQREAEYLAWFDTLKPDYPTTKK